MCGLSATDGRSAVPAPHAAVFAAGQIAALPGQAGFRMEPDESGHVVVYTSGQIKVGVDGGVEAVSDVVGLVGGAGATALAPLDNQAFSCIPVHALKKGDVLTAEVSNPQSWTTERVPLPIGSNTLTYPRVGVIQHPLTNNAYTFYVFQPAVLKAKVDLKPGVTNRSGGFEITATRAVKAGDSIPAIYDGPGRVFSAEADEGVKNTSDARPWFTAFGREMEPGDRADAIRAWRIEWRRARR